ncbi:MAG: hypothetical protein ACC726_00195 [Chloroflexota bacterium]
MMQTPDVVVVGAATRDLNESDPRGWLLGGGVTFGALALARLGLRTGVVLGLDDEASSASELDLIRQAGAEIVIVPLERGPVFLNVETPAGRVQTCESVSDPIPVEALPTAWRDAGTWMLAPVASELTDDWAAIPPEGACVALGWQGILRVLRDGERVMQLRPGPSPLLARADIVSVSRHDIPGDLDLRELGAWLAPSADVVLTAGLLGGMLIHFRDGRIVGSRVYASIASRQEVDPAGAGDTMLSGLVAARLALGGEGQLRGRDLRIGAAVASVLVEGPGMNAMPRFAQLRERLQGGV